MAPRDGLAELLRRHPRVFGQRDGGVERLADERVGEPVAPRLLLVLDHDAAGDRLSDRVDELVRGPARHLAERREGELTSERLGEIWLEVQRESLGPAIELKPGYETFWCYIPHFVHAPFYVYAYAFGDCLVNSLYAVYEKAESGFQEKYFAMLKAGGTKRHKELLAPFGLDATDPGFWQMGLSVIERLIGELEKLENA